MLNKFINYISQGKKKYIASCILGCFATLAFPPIFLTPILFISFPFLLILVQKSENTKQAFFIGWWFGFGHFVSGLYWISISLLIEPEKYAWLIPFAVSAIPAVISIYPAIATVILKFITQKFRVKNSAQILLFSLLWMGAEYLRSTLLTGFPWNLLGYVWTVSDITMQLASIFGVEGLGVFAIIIFSAPFALKDKKFIALVAILSIFIIGFGYIRLQNSPDEVVEGVKLRLVQANIPQNLKNSREQRFANLMKHINMSKSDGIEDVTHVIWSESSLPFYIYDDRPLPEIITYAIPKDGILITGAGRFEDRKPYNSLVAIDKSANLVAHYDKVHLVPFGEYVPFRDKISIIDAIAGDYGDFSEGEFAGSMKVKNAPPFAPQICYEGIFPKLAKKNGAKWILNVTNDGWFGKSLGPYQHFNMLRMRSAEQGIPAVRVANTGITAVVDSYGIVKNYINLGVSGTLDIYLPKNIKNYTIYSNYKCYTLLSLVLSIILVFWLLNNKEIKNVRTFDR